VLTPLEILHLALSLACLPNRTKRIERSLEDATSRWLCSVCWLCCGGRDSYAVRRTMPSASLALTLSLIACQEVLACHTFVSCGSQPEMEREARHPPRQIASTSRRGSQMQHCKPQYACCRNLGSRTSGLESLRSVSRKVILILGRARPWIRLNKLSKSKGIFHFICASTHSCQSIIH
jgi:hypothetical protein